MKISINFGLSVFKKKYFVDNFLSDFIRSKTFANLMLELSMQSSLRLYIDGTIQNYSYECFLLIIFNCVHMFNIELDLTFHF